MSNYFDKGGDSDLPAVLSEGGVSVAIQLAQAELNQAVTTARAFPRSYGKVMERIESLATLDAVTAGECIYAVPRDGKPVKGPSVRFAELVAASYGNCHSGSRIVAVDRGEKVVIAEGVFWDLETGAKITKQIQRRISGKNGKLFSDDMIATTGNAAASIALREAILKGVPKALWRGAYDKAERVTLGTIETLAVRRAKMISAFGGFGVTADQILASLEVDSVDDVGLDEVQTMIGVFQSIKAGEYTVESYFPPKADPIAARAAAKATSEKAQAGKAEEQNQKAIEAEKIEPEKVQPRQRKAEPREAVKYADDTAMDAPQAKAAPVEKEDQSAADEGKPAQASLLPEETTEVDYSTNSKLRQFVADVVSMGSLDDALDLWADDLDQIKDRNPDLHSAMMAAGTKADADRQK